MKKLYLFLAMSLLPILGISQFTGDTLIVYVDNRVELMAAIPDYSALKSSDDVVNVLQEFEALLPGLKDQLSPEAPELLKFSSGGAHTVEPGNPKVIYLPKDDKLSNTGFRDQAIINGKDLYISITTTDISKVSELPLSGCMEMVIAQLPDKIRWSKTLSYECVNGVVTALEAKNNEFDMLGLQFGVGGGLVRDKWIPDISFGISLGLNHKGIPRGPYVSSNMLFDFDSENNLNINTFLNIGYAWTIDKKSDNSVMLGVDLGYLIVKQGDLFGENTFKLGVNWSPAKYVTVSPQLYITDNFKQAFPGIRVGFGF